jgi:hypothetical protein
MYIASYIHLSWRFVPRSISAMIEQSPIGWRVWYEHHQAKLTSSKRPPQEFADFPTEEEALNFKRSFKERCPHSVACMEPIYVTTKARTMRPNGRRRAVAGKQHSQWGLRS